MGAAARRRGRAAAARSAGAARPSRRGGFCEGRWGVWRSSAHLHDGGARNAWRDGSRRSVHAGAELASKSEGHAAGGRGSSGAAAGLAIQEATMTRRVGGDAAAVRKASADEGEGEGESRDRRAEQAERCGGDGMSSRGPTLGLAPKWQRNVFLSSPDQRRLRCHSVDARRPLSGPPPHSRAVALRSSCSDRRSPCYAFTSCPAACHVLREHHTPWSPGPLHTRPVTRHAIKRLHALHSPPDRRLSPSIKSKRPAEKGEPPPPDAVMAPGASVWRVDGYATQLSGHEPGSTGIDAPTSRRSSSPRRCRRRPPAVPSATTCRRVDAYYILGVAARIAPSWPAWQSTIHQET